MKFEKPYNLHVRMTFDDGQEVDYDFLGDARVGIDDLVGDLVTHVDRYGWFTAMLELAEVLVDRKSEALKDAEAVVRATYSEGGKKYEVDCLVRLSPEVIKAREDWFKAREDLAIMRGGEKAFLARHMVLRQLSGQLNGALPGDGGPLGAGSEERMRARILRARKEWRSCGAGGDDDGTA